tara:strand:- start:141 stop:803 length:663 start_codon:yes stop_codon:yes gene_type:complete
MRLEQLAKRVDDLIELSLKVSRSRHTKYSELLNTELFNEFRSSALSFIKSLVGENHPYYKEFNTRVRDIDESDTQEGRGILNSIKREIDNGYLTTLKGIVSAEIFTDFLEMAEHLLEENYKDPAAVMIGSVLEEHLRQLCQKNSIDTFLMKNDKQFPKKADLINSELSSSAVYNKLDQKAITTWLDLRNKAAHGRYNDYNLEQVKLMYQGVIDFITRNQL